MLLSPRLWSAAYAVVLGAVGVLSLLPEVRHLAGSDVVSHCLAYAAVALCAGFAFRSLSARAAAAGAMVLTGAGLEIAQSMLPGRVPSVTDALVNAAGIVLGLILADLALRAAAAMHPALYGRRAGALSPASGRGPETSAG